MDGNSNVENQLPPADDILQIYAQQRARLLSTLLFIFSPVTLIILLIWNIANPNFTWAHILTLIIIGSYLATYRLSRSKYFQLGASLLILMIFIVVIGVMLKAPRPYVERLPSLTFLAISVMLASVLLSLRATFVTSAISILGITTLLTVHEIPENLVFTFFAFMLCVAVLSMVSAHVQKQVLLELDAQKTALKERETLFRELAEQSPDMLFFIDSTTQKLLYSNRTDFVGYSTADPDFLGNVRQHIHLDDRSAVGKYWSSLTEPQDENNQHVLEYRIHSKLGNLVWIQSRKSVISLTAEGLPKLVLITTSDITELKNQSLRQMEATLEDERSKILADFIRDASHEFRTPLSTILTNVYMLNQINQSDSSHKLIQQIEQQSGTITALVDAMTLLAKLNSNVTLELETFALSELVDDVKVASYPTILNRQHKVVIEASEPPPMIVGDRRLLSDAFKHLLDNAARHTPDKGTITIRFYERQTMGVVEIQDTGIGISNEMLPRIFDTFFRVDTAHSTVGFGLGLSVVKRIAEHHNGQVEVESEVGVGSTFRMVFAPPSG